MLGGAKYILRLADACPTMKFSSWQRIEKILDQYSIISVSNKFRSAC
jgi:hypothetical protein